MTDILTNAMVYVDGKFQKLDVAIDQGLIVQLSAPHQGSIAKDSLPGTANYIDCSNYYIFPGFCDLHVHFRQPGFSYKETIKSGSLAGARGGYTIACTMPNLKPVPDSLENLEKQLEIIKKDAKIHVLPYAAITKEEAGEELSDFEDLAAYVVGFSDDGVGLDSDDLMKKAMLKAKELNRPIVAHAEYIELVKGGVIHDGTYAKRHNLPGNPSESEWKQVERDLRLAEETGCRYHICHISSKESVELLRRAQKAGVKASGETGPHYLSLTDEDLRDEGRFRMNPPIRSGADREALREALKDGSLLAIATDHAPHSQEEKSGGLRNSLNGVVGLETAFPVLYTDLVLTGIISLEELVAAMSSKPISLIPEDIKEAREGVGIGRKIAVGQPADLTIFDLNAYDTINPDDFLSMGKASPFTGKVVRACCLATYVGGVKVYDRDQYMGGKKVYKRDQYVGGVKVYDRNNKELGQDA